MSCGGRGNIAGNPVLIGAATVLVVIVAVFLSYNANQGLPFVPTYKLTAEVPSAANLVRGNEVRIGGTRVGTVDAIGVERRDDGDEHRRCSALKLERSVEPLPIDSTLLDPPALRARPQVRRDHARHAPTTASPTATRSRSRTPRPTPVEFDEFIEHVRRADARGRADEPRRSSATRSPAAARRLNQAIGAFRPLLARHHPGRRRTSSSPETDLRALRRASSADAARDRRAGRRERRPRCSSNLDATFGALREVARPYIQESISEGPATLDAAIESLPRAAAVPGQHRGAVPRAAARASRALRPRAPDLADALEVGTPTLRRYAAFNARLDLAARRARRRSPRTRWCRAASAGLTERRRRSSRRSSSSRRRRRPATTSSLWFRNVSSLLSEGDDNGTWQRFIIVATPQGPNNEGGPPRAPADGPTLENHLHSNPYPNTAVAGPAARVRGGQRALPRGPDRDRQRARAPSRPRRSGRRPSEPPAPPQRPRARSPSGSIALVVHRRPHLPRLHEGRSRSRAATRSRPTFESANGLRPDSPVRIAGVDVGKVTKVDAEEGTDNAVVTMEIDDEGLPMPRDATAKIRPRIFLEGNFFVDLQPGTPGAEELDDGGTLKVTQTATPVQLDQVLTALQSDSRQDLQDVLDALGPALSGEPSAEDDARGRSVGARRDRRRVVQRRLRRHRARPSRRRRRSTRRCSAPSPSRTSAG